MAKKRAAVPRHSSPRKGRHRTENKDDQVLVENSQGQISEVAALYRLMAWLSPAYPVGAFAYSSGLEWAVEAGDVTSTEKLFQWLATLLSDGMGYCDAVLFVHAYRACTAGDDKGLGEVAELAAALAPSRERFLETTAQGQAFFDVTRASWPCRALDRLSRTSPGPVAYPVAVAVASAGHGISLRQSLAAYLQALAANWVSVGVRVIPLGQTDGQRVTAMLEPSVAAIVKRALGSALDDVGGAVFRADIAAMRHETQYTRLFRS